MNFITQYADGRVMLCVWSSGDDNNSHSTTFWFTPETVRQVVDALTRDIASIPTMPDVTAADLGLEDAA